MFKRFFCAMLVMALTVGLWYVASVTYNPLYGAVDAETMVVDTDSNDAEKNTLTIWYTDEALTDYLSSVSLSFQQNQNVKVNYVLKSGVEFLEAINKISITDKEERPEAMPDLYITSHDNLLRAYLSGLASVIQDPEGIMNQAAFPDTALNAVTCYGNLVAYPLYYETNYFLYNKTYMAMIAQKSIETETDFEEGAAATKELEENGAPTEEAKIVGQDEESAEDNKDTIEDSDNNDNPEDEERTDDTEDGREVEGEEELEDPMGEEDAIIDQEVRDRLATMIPATLEDVKTFANNYDAPEKVEAVFKWDINDIFYNYFFVGKYMDVGGKDGDNAAMFNIYNSQAVECLEAYQDMNQFFEFDRETDSYEQLIQDFIDGKLVFTVATTDAIAKIDKARMNGSFDFDYGITTLPDISSLLKARGLSVTDAVVVNGYSDKMDMANLLAAFVVNDKAGELYNKTGKISCNKMIQQNDEVAKIMTEYEKSVPLPKMVETANYWVQLEIAFTKIWNGADPDETLRELSDTIGAQIEEIRANLPTQESFTAGGGKYIQ